MKMITLFASFFFLNIAYAQDTISINKLKRMVNGYTILNEDGSVDYVKYSMLKKKLISTETYDFNISYKFEPEIFAPANISNDTINFEKATTIDGKRIYADYPMLAIDNDIEGKVIVKFIVEIDGSLSNISIEKGAHPLLDKACIDKLSKIKFKPAYKDGKPIRVSERYPFSFILG